MIRKLLTSTALAGGLLVAAGSAQAGVIDFILTPANFTTGGDFTSLAIHTSTVKGITLKVTALSDGNPALVDPDSEGTGVEEGDGSTDDDDIDGEDDTIETLKLSFFWNGNPVHVKLLELEFDNVDDNDEYDVFVDGKDLAINEMFGNDLFEDGTVPEYDCDLADSDNCIVDFSSITFLENVAGFPAIANRQTMIEVRAEGSNDNFKLLRVRVEVPEPASLGLFGAGLAGLGALRRRPSVR